MSRPIPPVLITGCPRSGTTWVGEIVSTSARVLQIYEPFNSDNRHHLNLPLRYFYVTKRYEPEVLSSVRSLIGIGERRKRFLKCAKALQGRAALQSDLGARLALRELKLNWRSFLWADRVLLKDPLAFFSAEWLARNFDMKVVVLIRHPAGVVSSYMKLEWTEEPFRAFQSWMTQPDLVKRFLPGLRPAIEAHMDNPEDDLAAYILKWRVFSQVTNEFRSAHPDWLFVKHEDLCHDPAGQFRTIFDYLGVPWSLDVERRIRRDSASANVVDPLEHRQHLLQRNSKALSDAWRRRLPSVAIGRILEETTEERRLFNYD